MGFLNPALLFALAAVSVPILIHLLNRRQVRHVRWAAMRFLQSSVDRNQRRLRIEDLLLLFLRCLVLALLALALARPALRKAEGGWFGMARPTVLLLLDNSYSMSETDGTQSRFDLARTAAEEVLDVLPGGSPTAVFLASDIVRKPIPEPTNDGALVRKTLRDARLSDRGTELVPAIEAGLEMLGRMSGSRKELYVFTDGRANGWRAREKLTALLAAGKERITAHVVLVGRSQGTNIAVTDLRPGVALVPANQSIPFQIKVGNFAAGQTGPVPVTLQIDADPPADETTLDRIEPGGDRSATLFARFRGPGLHSVTARVSGDRLPADDQRTIIVRVVDDLRLLLVDGDPGTEPRTAETFYLRRALVPVAPLDAARFHIKPTIISPSQLGSAVLDPFAAVFLCNVGGLPDNALHALENHLVRGGGLVVFPGDRSDRTFMNERLLSKFGFLPASLEAPTGDASNSKGAITYQPSGYEHPIVERWNDAAAGTLASATFRRRFPLVPDTTPSASGNPLAATPGIVLRNADGSPAVIARTWGRGRVLLFSGPADTAWSDLSVRPAFVPLVHRALGWVTAGRDESLNLPVGGHLAEPLDPEFRDRSATVTLPDATTDSARIESGESETLLRYDRIDNAGAFDVTITGEPPWSHRFAAQAATGESDLAEITPETLTALGARLLAWEPGLNLREMLRRDRTGTELWLALALATLVAAVAETVLAERFSRSK